MLKTDLHTHAGTDSNHTLDYSPKELINVLAKSGYDVFSITNHEMVACSKDIRDHAKKRGLLFIPGIEKRIENREVIILNADKRAERLKTFDDLRKYKEKRDVFVIAPHPFYPDPKSLHSKLSENISLFDGIEFSHFYVRFWTFNTKAVKTAQKHSLPLIGTSDCHRFDQLNRTYTLVDADKRIGSVFEALRKKRIKLVTSPLPLLKAARIITSLYVKY